MRVHTLTLDAFYVYLAMGPDRNVVALSQRFGLPEGELWRRALTEDWDGRIEGVESEILHLPPRQLASSVQQLFLGQVVEAADRIGAIPGLRLGLVPLGTQILVQLQRSRRGGPR